MKNNKTHARDSRNHAEATITEADAGDSAHAARHAMGATAITTTCRRALQGLVCGIMLQASGCTFDTEAFLNDSLTAVYNNIATTFIITALADLLNVAPTFGF